MFRTLFYRIPINQQNIRFYSTKKVEKYQLLQSPDRYSSRYMVEFEKYVEQQKDLQLDEANKRSKLADTSDGNPHRFCVSYGRCGTHDGNNRYEKFGDEFKTPDFEDFNKD